MLSPEVATTIVRAAAARVRSGSRAERAELARVPSRPTAAIAANSPAGACSPIATMPREHSPRTTYVVPAEVEVGGPNPVQLGLIVASAHERSGFTVEDWNALTDEEREALLNAEVERLKSNNAVLNDLAEKAPKDVRAWLVEQGVNVNGVKNADLLPTAAAYLHEKR